MKLTNKLMEDLGTIRRDIKRFYSEELCDRVERSSLVALSKELRITSAELANLYHRIGIDIAGDPYSGGVDHI